MKWILVSLSWVSLAAAEDGRAVLTHVCSEMKEREPLRCLTSHTALLPGSRLYAISYFTHFNSSQKVWQVWSYENQEIFKTELDPESSGWRAETNVDVAGKDGTWTLKLEDDKGRLLEKLTFVVAQGDSGTRARLLSESEQAKAENLQGNVAAAEQPILSITAPTSIVVTPVASTEIPVKTRSSAGGEFSIGLHVGPSFDRLDSLQKANSTDAQFLSDPLFDTNIELGYLWPGRQLATTFSVGLETNDYQSVSGKTLIGIPSTLWNFELGQEFRNVLPHLHLRATFGMSQDFFDIATSDTHLNFASVTLPEASLGPIYVPYEQSGRELSVQGSLVRQFAESTSQYDVDGAWGLKARGAYQFALDEKMVESVGVGVNYEKLWQETTFVQRTKAELGFDFFFTRRIGK